MGSSQAVCRCSARSRIAKERVEASLLRGTFYRRSRDFRKASHIFEHASSAARDIGDSSLEAAAQLTRGGLYRAMRDLPRALAIFERGLEFFGHDDVMSMKINEAIADCSKDLGLYSRALVARRRRHCGSERRWVTASLVVR